MDNIQSFTNFLNEEVTPEKNQMVTGKKADFPMIKQKIEQAIKKGEKVHMFLSGDNFAVIIDKITTGPKIQFNIKPAEANELGIFDMFAV